MMTEANSHYDNLEQKKSLELLQIINQEDHTVAQSVAKVLPAIASLVEKVVEQFNGGGRLFYIGSGTSGRLGVVDASECPPTFGVPQGMVIGLIAGGDPAIRVAVENAEDDPKAAFQDLKAYHVSPNDIVVGIAASGRTPYVVGGLKECQENGIPTGCITCNSPSPIEEVADFPVSVATGPEVVTGSTRMKAGTAQKMVLNMITTTAMIRIGRVQGNKMVHMQLSNSKLRQRAVRILQDQLLIDEKEAEKLIATHGSVYQALSAK